MLGRFKGFALATTAVLSITTFGSAAQAGTLFWDRPSDRTDRSFTYSAVGGLFTNWKEQAGGFDLPAQFNSSDILVFGADGYGLNSDTATNVVDNLVVGELSFSQEAGSFRLTGDKIFLGPRNLVTHGLMNHSASRQNIDFDIRVISEQIWETNGGLFDINGDVELNFDPNFEPGARKLTVTGSGSTNIDGNITGAANTEIEKNGNGTLVLSGNNSGFLGDIDLNNGRLHLNRGDNISSETTIDISGDAVLDLNGPDQDIGGLSGTGGSVDLTSSASLVVGHNDENTTYEGDIFGNGSLGKAGAGTLTLRGDNTYSGGTTVSGGTLKGDTDSLQGDILNHATLMFDQDTSGTYGGVLSGTGDLIKDGSGTLTVSNVNNTYSGGTTIVNGGTLRGNTTSLRGGIINNANVEFNQSFDGVALDISGTGNVTISGGSAIRFNRNSYLGTTRVNGSTLRLGSGDALSNSTTVILNNGTLDFDGTGENFGGLSGDGTVDLSSGAVMGVGYNNANTTFSGAITGNGTVTKAGTGTLTLTGNNSYTGATTVSNGQLRLDDDGDIDQSSSLSVGQIGIFNAARNREACSGFGCGFNPGPGIYGYSYGGTVNNQGIIRGGNGVTSGTGTGTLTLTGDVSGAGSFEGVVAINGTFRPGNSPALVSAETLNFSSTTALFMEVGGYGRGSEYDAIDATSITLDGLLDIALLDLGNNFTPMAGNTFDLIVANQIFGEFSSFNFAALAEGLFWTTQLISGQAGMIYQLVVDGQLVGVAVPAPGALILLLVGVAGVGVMRRRAA